MNCISFYTDYIFYIYNKSLYCMESPSRLRGTDESIPYGNFRESVDPKSRMNADQIMRTIEERCKQKAYCSLNKCMDPCNDNKGYGYGWGVIWGMIACALLFFCIFLIVAYLILYSLRPSWVMNPDDGTLNASKILFWSFIFALAAIIVIYLIVCFCRGGFCGRKACETKKQCC